MKKLKLNPETLIIEDQLKQLSNTIVKIEYFFKNGGMIKSSGFLTKETAVTRDQIYVIRNKIGIPSMSHARTLLGFFDSSPDIDNSIFIFKLNDVSNIRKYKEFYIIEIMKD